MSLNRFFALSLAMIPATAVAGESHCQATHAGSRLASVTLFDGPPSERADLMPDTVSGRHGNGRSDWDIAYIFQAGRRLFVRCEYGPQVHAIIFEPDTRARKCVYRRYATGHRSLACK